jgi:hypothetical protein
MTADVEWQAIEVRTEWEDGVSRAFLVGEWPERTRMSGALVKDANPLRLRLDSDRIVLTLDSGSAVYRIDRYVDYLDVYECTRES